MTSRVLAGALLCGVALAGCGSMNPSRQAQSVSATPVSTANGAGSLLSPTPSAMASRPSTVAQNLVALPGLYVTCGVLNGSVLYAAAGPISGPIIATDALLRVDIATGQVDRLTRAVVGCPVLADGGVWFADADADVLVEADPSNLTVRHSFALPSASQYAIAAAGGGLWVASTRTLWRIDPVTGRRQLGLGLPAGLQSVSLLASRDGAVLYVGLGASPPGPAVEARDPIDGHLLAGPAYLPGTATIQLVYADTSGLWVSYPTGMLAAVTKLAPDTLTGVTELGLGDGDDAEAGTNGLVAVADQQRVVVATLDQLDCYPSGSTRPATTSTANGAPLAMDGEHLYVAVWPNNNGKAAGIETVPLPAGC